VLTAKTSVRRKTKKKREVLWRMPSRSVGAMARMHRNCQQVEHLSGPKFIFVYINIKKIII